MRVEQAEKAMQNFLDRFYVVDEDNDRGEIVGEFFWTRAEMFEIVVDAYEKTGEEKYKDLMAQMYRGFGQGSFFMQIPFSPVLKPGIYAILQQTKRFLTDKRSTLL